MTARSLGLAAMTLAFLSGPALAAEEANQFPLRKAGSWELKTTMDQGKGPQEQPVITMCVETSMEASTAKASMIEHAATCTKYDVKRDGQTTVIDADCTFGIQNTKSRTEMSGDFQAAFTVKIESTTMQQARDGKDVPVNRVINQTGRYLGEACGDLKHGEAMTADGTKLMVQ